MNTIVKGLVRDEKGRAMLLTLLLLVVGGLTLTPLLGLMSTGLVSGEIYERKTKEFYAADAGVELAIGTVFYQGGTSVDGFESNSCDVTVYIEEIPWDDISQDTKDTFDLLEGDRAFFIESTGRSSAQSSTTVECYFAITYTSPCDEETYEYYSGSGDINGINAIVEAGDTIYGNIAEDANVWNVGGFSCTGNVEKYSTVNVVGDALFNGSGNIVDGATLFVFGNCEINGNIKLSDAYVSGNLWVGGSIQISNVAVGGDLHVVGNIESDVYVDGTVTLDGNWVDAEQRPLEEAPFELTCPLALKTPKIVSIEIV